MANSRRGDAEVLRRYWTHGKGGTEKIRWGESGDFDRCVREVGKYAAKGGFEPKRYCAQRHKEALGVWPGQEHGGKNKKKSG